MSSGKTWLKRRWPILAVTVVIAGILLGNRGLRRVIRHSLELRRLRSQLGTLVQEEETLRRKISQAQRDDHTLERTARKELGYIKPGEVEYRFTPPK